MLYIEDNPSNVALVERLASAARASSCIPPPAATRASSWPGGCGRTSILLDLHLPDTTGDAVLAQLRADDRHARRPGDRRDRRRHPGPRAAAARRGRAYMTKPLDLSRFGAEIDRALGARPR